MIRTKFTLYSKTFWAGGQVSLLLTPVFSHDPDDPNHVFWQATPIGKIELSIDHLEAAEGFEVGKSYYVDFSEAE